MTNRNIIVAISGATGAIYGIRLLEALRVMEEVTIHLVISDWGRENIELEAGYSVDEVAGLAHYVYAPNDLGARIASGSFLTHGMVVAPCSMKMLASIACGFADNLIARAADVTIKEGRRLIICPRETPLNAIQLENMLKLSRLNVCIAPPMPAFYTNPKSIDDIVAHHTMKLLDLLGLKNETSARWNG